MIFWLSRPLGHWSFPPLIHGYRQPLVIYEFVPAQSPCKKNTEGLMMMVSSGPWFFFSIKVHCSYGWFCGGQEILKDEQKAASRVVYCPGPG